MLGIVVTFVSYFGQHSRVTLADLEPGLTARWNRVRGWERRVLGRTTTVSLGVGTTWAVLAVGSATAWFGARCSPATTSWCAPTSWSETSTRSWPASTRCAPSTSSVCASSPDGLSTRFTELDQLGAERDAVSRQRATAAMRWEVRGPLITLLGAGLSIFG